MSSWKNNWIMETGPRLVLRVLNICAENLKGKEVFCVQYYLKLAVRSVHTLQEVLYKSCVNIIQLIKCIHRVTVEPH